MNSLERQQLGDELLLRAAALRLVAQALAQGVRESAARIAQTLDDVARVQDAIATNGVSTTAHAREHTEHAQRAASPNMNEPNNSAGLTSPIREDKGERRQAIAARRVLQVPATAMGMLVSVGFLTYADGS